MYRMIKIRVALLGLLMDAVMYTMTPKALVAYTKFADCERRHPQILDNPILSTIIKRIL